MKAILRILPLITLIACEKAGPIGPIGPMGNANVQSETHYVEFWNYSTSPVCYYADINTPLLTNDIIQSGAVLVYLQLDEDYYTQLPMTFYRSDQYSSSLTISSKVNQVRVVWTDSDLTQPITPSGYYFKVVAISASALAAHPKLDLTDYSSVARTFDLE